MQVLDKIVAPLRDLAGRANCKEDAAIILSDRVWAQIQQDYDGHDAYLNVALGNGEVLYAGVKLIRRSIFERRMRLL